MLKAIGPLAVPATMVPASDQPGGQVTQETQELMAEAKRLVAAMYSNFKGELNRLSIAGFETFGDVALALDMHWVYFKLIEANLAVSCLLQCVYCLSNCTLCCYACAGCAGHSHYEQCQQCRYGPHICL